MRTSLNASYVRSILDYEEETGLFRWRYRADRRRNWNTRYAGAVAGCRRDDDYITIVIDAKVFYAHRLAWLWMTGEWPLIEIDHWDTCHDNNRWKNLRLATGAQNKRNVKRRRSNASGVIGVSYYPPTNRWRARIKVDGREIALGYFRTKAEAATARYTATKELHGEFGRAA